MDCKKYLVTVSVTTEHSAGWDTWENTDTKRFEGDDLSEVKSLALEYERKCWHNTTQVNYYKQAVEMRPTVIRYKIDSYGETDEQREESDKLSRKEKYLKLKEEFGEQNEQQ